MVAIVEEIEADRSKAVFMDPLGTGHTIELGIKGRLILGYLNGFLGLGFHPLTECNIGDVVSDTLAECVEFANLTFG